MCVSDTALPAPSTTHTCVVVGLSWAPRAAAAYSFAVSASTGTRANSGSARCSSRSAIAHPIASTRCRAASGDGHEHPDRFTPSR